jgi:hypothetical protein
MITLGVTNGNEPLSVSVITRAADSHDADGNGVKGAASDPVAIDADVQPAAGKVLRDLPEGVRDESSHVVWTPFDLQLDHIVVYEGKNHRVVEIYPRRSDGFTKAAIARVGK